MSESLPPPLPVPSSARADRVWGFWASLGFGLVIFGGFMSAHAAVLVPYAFYLAATGREVLPDQLEENGLMLALGTCVSTPVIVGLAWVLAAIRRGPAPKDYLGLVPVSVRAAVRWSIALLLFVVASDGITTLLGRPIVPDVIFKMYQTAQWKPLLWLAIVVMAPVGEEIFFRGFLFRGFERSRLGSWGTIALTSALWAVIHLQYDAYGITTIFLGGLLLGYARLATGSVLLTILLHGVMNFVATVQVEVLAGHPGGG